MALQAALVTADKERVAMLRQELLSARFLVDSLDEKLQVARATQEANLRMMRAERGAE